MAQGPDVRVSELRDAFLAGKQARCQPHSVKNYRWALNYHQAVHPLLCWDTQDLIYMVEQQPLTPWTKHLLYASLKEVYQWAGYWVRGHYPDAAPLPRPLGLPKSHWSGGKRAKRRQQERPGS